MTVGNDEDLQRLKAIGRIVADALQRMARSLEAGMTTGELDAIGRAALEEEGARSAPELSYGFPGATCISVNEEVAHGIPGERRIEAGDLVNIDVSAEKDGFFADTGASFPVPPVSVDIDRLCRDGRRALSAGVRKVRADRPLASIGEAVGRFADKHGYTLVRNLASHGVGRSLHEEPKEIPTWPDPFERRRIHSGMVFTIEPFLSLGADWAELAPGDPWTLLAIPRAPTVQYEHTLVATRQGALVLTRPSA